MVSKNRDRQDSVVQIQQCNTSQTNRYIARVNSKVDHSYVRLDVFTMDRSHFKNTHVQREEWTLPVNG